MFESKIQSFGPITLPAFSGTRVMMMPFLMEEPVQSIPDTLEAWRPAIAQICSIATVKRGVGYLTIDEAFLKKGETLRRPGLHVDGCGAWGGGGNYGANGMFLATSHTGALAYPGWFHGQPGPDGDCEHLRDEIDYAVPLTYGKIWWCSPLALHEAIPVGRDMPRQLIRVSMPSNAPYHLEYTPNPTGVEPAGVPAAARAAQMAYRP